ncbi:hypothetical protein V5O48_017738 [Marasmius crinis-equi]|uniref:Tetratricopeptide repeat protein n=1 Tax=Marasmius crinis-equi TaxID=585013 RepID=A0ABR3EN48_9AGAR
MAESLSRPRASVRYFIDRLAGQLQFHMPNLEVVRQEVQEVKDAIKEPLPNVQCFSRAGMGTLHPGLVYRIRVPNLFRFALWCHVDDVPSDLLHVCIWALEWRIRVCTEAPEEQMMDMLIEPFNIRDPGTNEAMVDESRWKIVKLCLRPDVNWPSQAAFHCEATLRSRGKTNFISTDTFLDDPEIYVNYGSALARMKTRDEEAKEVLNKVIEDASQTPDSLSILLEARLFLARVLRRNQEEMAAGIHETHLASWLKKNPRRIEESRLQEWFGVDDGTEDPVLKALGAGSGSPSYIVK